MMDQKPEPCSDDHELVEQALETLLTYITPRQFSQLADRVRRRGEKGFGRITMLWHNGRPVLLIEEDSEQWR